MVSDRSNGIYRGIVATLVGLTLIGAAELPKKDAQPEQAKEQQEIADTLKDIAASLKEAQKPDQTTQPCDPKKPNRNSDLCAQWKAADAAADAAEAAWRQMLIGWIGVVLGGITMAAAVAAAFYARSAAIHSKTGSEAAIAAHNSFIASERAYISFYAGKLVKQTDGFDPYFFQCYVHNLGKSAGTIKSIRWEITMPIFPASPNFQIWQSQIIRPSEENPVFNNSILLEKLDAKFSLDDLWHNKIWAMGFLDYESVGRKFRSHFCFEIKFNEASGYTEEQWDVIRGTCSDMPEDT
jgi:hypothetical protein